MTPSFRFYPPAPGAIAFFGFNATLTNVTVRSGNSTPPAVRGTVLAQEASSQPCYDITATSGLGGGLLGVDSTAVITGSSVTDCTASAGGAVFFTGAPSSVLIDGTLLARNRAGRGAAVVAAGGAALVLRGTRVVSNAASSAGAAFLSGASSLSAVDCVFDRSTASYAGGAFVVGADARIAVNRSTIQSSHAGIAGVALLCSSQSELPPFLVDPAKVEVTLANNRRAQCSSRALPDPAHPMTRGCVVPSFLAASFELVFDLNSSPPARPAQCRRLGRPLRGLQRHHDHHRPAHNARGLRPGPLRCAHGRPRTAHPGPPGGAHHRHLLGAVVPDPPGAKDLGPRDSSAASRAPIVRLLANTGNFRTALSD